MPKLTELDPRWLFKDGKRAGVVFHNPLAEHRKWWVTCFGEPMSYDQQEASVHAAIGETDMWQGCNETVGWNFMGGIDKANFETLSITPSLDGGPH